ncbi:unnamed protein product, partial [Strongylus vulgaris]
MATKLHSPDVQDDGIWMTASSFTIFTMTAGFGLLESGRVSSKDEVNVMVKNVVDVIFGGLAYWMFGYGFTFGERYVNPFVGVGDYFFDPEREDTSTPDKVPPFSCYETATAPHIMNQYTKEGTKGLILCLALITRHVPGIFSRHGRTHSPTVALFRILLHHLSALGSRPLGLASQRGVPVNGCCRFGWMQCGEWARKRVSIVRSRKMTHVTQVHLVGGVSGLVATLYLKPRRYRFEEKRARQMSDPTKAILGFLMIWWGWLAFNTASNYSVSHHQWTEGSRSAVGTIMASAGGGMMTVLISRCTTKKIQVDMVIDGMLASLVSSTAGCLFYTPWQATLVGAIGSAMAVMIYPLLEKAKIDDPVGVVPVHVVGS